MLRAIVPILINEFRLVARDRVALPMLVVAPAVIIAVAGFSLGNIFGARPSGDLYLTPVVNLDRGRVAQAILDALKRDRALDIIAVADLPEALQILRKRDRAPVAIVIPAGTTKALENGGVASLELYTDPVKRLEVNVLEVRLDQLCNQITMGARAQARRELAMDTARARGRIEGLVAQAKRAETQAQLYRREFIQGRARAAAALQTQFRRARESLEKEIQAEIDELTEQSKIALASPARLNALAAVNHYLDALRVSQREFDQWFAQLKMAAGSHSVDIPPPPVFPSPPSSRQLAELEKPPEVPSLRLSLPPPPQISLKLPDPPSIAHFELPSNSRSSVSSAPPVIPGRARME
jgi:hypothetical protein